MDEDQGQPLWAIGIVMALCFAAMFIIPIIDPPTPAEKLAAMPCVQRCLAQDGDDCYIYCGCIGNWSHLE